MLFCPYLSSADVTCFDNAPPPGDPPPGDPPPGDPPPGDPPAPKTTFTQDDVNKFVADERRKAQKALEKTEQTYKELLESSKTLTAQERASLEEALTTVQGQLRTKEDQAKLEKKQLESQYAQKLTEAEKIAQTWEARFRESTLKRELMDAAAANDAYRPDQIVTMLRGNSKLVEKTDENGRLTGEYKVVIDFGTIDETGAQKTSVLSPQEAVKQMQNMEEYKNLFRNNVVSGIGGSSTPAGYPANSDGTVNLKKLAQNPEAFRKMLKENPQAILGN